MTTYKIDHDNNKSTKETHRPKDKENHEKEKLDKKSNTDKDGVVTTDVDVGSPLEPEKDISTY